MATRQYIGARYVPRFDGNWDNTKDYEPLVIVSYQGNSYTSRTFVPHGTAITNEAYWALTGNYNAQVEAYRQEVQTLESDFIKLREDIGYYVTPEMFGAKGDGTTNDHDAFSDCAAYANSNHASIIVPCKEYYIDGDPIRLKCNVKCLNSVFIVGNSHFRQSQPVFYYSHDNETAEIETTLSNILVDNDTVRNDYRDKFFVLDTGIAYGTGLGPNTPDDETVMECIITNGNITEVLFDDVTDYLNKTVKALHISDMKETGYTFEGAIIKQKTENSYGICFLRVRRNNMTIRDIQIKANCEYGEHSVFLIEYSCNVTIDNVKGYSIQPVDIWGYEISTYYCGNVYVNNFKAFNAWSSIANRGLKNYTLKNSVTSTFDCHWNCYGKFVCDNNILYKSAHLGYGKGEYIVINTVADYVSNRTDFVQVWCGKTVVRDCTLKNGFWFYLEDDESTDYDSFFDTIELPEITIDNITAEDKTVYCRIPNDTALRLGDKKMLLINNTNLIGMVNPYSNKAFKAIIQNCPATVNSRTAISQCADIVYDDNITLTGSITTDKFSDIFSSLQRSGNIVTVTFGGILTDTQDAYTTLLTLPEGFRPNSQMYAVACLSGEVLPVLIASNGNVQNVLAMNNANKRFVCTFSFANHILYS